MIKDVILHPGGMEFSITIQPRYNHVEIFYENQDLWFHMLHCFVPRKHETFEMLERRMTYSFTNWYRMLADKEHYKPIPEDFFGEFAGRFGLDIYSRMLVKKLNRREKLEMLANAVAGKAYLKNEVGIIELSLERRATLWHEAFHNVFWDNPYARASWQKQSKWKKYDRRFLPCPHNPNDKAVTYGEMLPEALYPTTMLPFPVECLPRTLETVALLGSMSASMAFGSLYPLIPAMYVAACNAVKVPRTIISAASAFAYKRDVKRIKKKLGERNAVRLMMVSGPKELKTLADICDKL